MNNFGRLGRDLIGGSLTIKSKEVLDANTNLTVKNAKVSGDLQICGNLTINGNVFDPDSATGGEPFFLFWVGFGPVSTSSAEIVPTSGYAGGVEMYSVHPSSVTTTSLNGAGRIFSAGWSAGTWICEIWNNSDMTLEGSVEFGPSDVVTSNIYGWGASSGETKFAINLPLSVQYLPDKIYTARFLTSSDYVGSTGLSISQFGVFD